MKIPERARRVLAQRARKPHAQRVLLALLLQAPPVLRGPRHHHYQRPPLAAGGRPFGGQAAAVRQD